MIPQIRSVAALRQSVKTRRLQGIPIILVPTMGNLHAGHMALIERAQSAGGCIVTTIFVNPTQFAEGEDYTEYPRTLDKDLEKLDDNNVDLVFVPEVHEMYSTDLHGGARVKAPELENKYCGRFRPGHFEGVATIVAKLFNIVLPDHAVFGEKDYQQLVIIRRMVRDLHYPINIISVPTVRETDGLAVSSRNAYLCEDERRRAPLFHKALAQMAEEINRGSTDYEQLQQSALGRLFADGFETDYVTVCDAETLSQPRDGELVILAAVRLGRTRLIDNILVRQ